MIRRLPSSLPRPLVSPARIPPLASTSRHAPSAVRFSSSVGKPTHPLGQNTGTTHPRRWIAGSIAIGTSALLVAYYYDSRSVVHEHVVMPLIRRLVPDAEDGHKIAVKILSLPSWARPHDTGIDGPELETELFGLPLSNPVGVAAGFDKDAQAIDGLFDLGFGYVEVGSVTPVPQAGNPKPRFFRLEEDEAAINRYGFNSLGHGHALAQLRSRLVRFAQEHPTLFPDGTGNPLPPVGLPRSLRPGHILGVNLGKNKTSPADSNDDYVKGVRLLGPYADVIVINVSSPNTPGLRALQGADELERLLTDVKAEREKIVVNGLPKIAVKVTCDLSEEGLADVATAVRKTGIDGVIISNTTLRREGLQSENKGQVGGLSGRPLFPYALAALRTLRPLLPPSVPIIGAGGIWTGEDALAMARAGASTVQVYTSFGYRGVGTPALIKDEVARILVPANSTWREQIGADFTGTHLGWDETRVAAESARLKAEAASLADVLRQASEKHSLASLVAETEAALARHNAPAPAPKLVQSAPASAPTPAPTVGLIAGVPEIAVVAAPGAPLPIEAPATPEPTRQDAWANDVRSGPRRLV
ncbi:Dihydroorotate dehydrogenase (quinone), mitochondrial [Vanrija albida]|uniref:Dihydroorotate dehydrogenase (quinone), mitochondrial n=1 Tax=Vanrija albida TaxID=181172 RepID=A0ABR3PYH8_9TREE